MGKDFHDKVLELMRLLREKGVCSMPAMRLKSVVAEVFGDDRHRLNFVIAHLREIGFVKAVGNGIIGFDFGVEEGYLKDPLFFL